MKFRRSLNLLFCLLLIFSVCFNFNVYALSPSDTMIAWGTGSYESVDDSSTSGWGTGSYDIKDDSSTSGWGTGSYNNSSGSSSGSSKYDKYDDYDYDYSPSSESISLICRIVVMILDLLPYPVRRVVVVSFILFLLWCSIRDGLRNSKKK